MKLVSLLYPASLILCTPLRAFAASVSSPSLTPLGQSLSSAASPSLTSSQTQQDMDMDTVLQRRLGFITTSATMVSDIASWHVPALHIFPVYI
jgi:hypothetical protein